MAKIPIEPLPEKHWKFKDYNLTIRELKKFDYCFLNFFAATKKQLLIASLLGKHIQYLHTKNPLPSLPSKSRRITPDSTLHDAQQNLRLLSHLGEHTNTALCGYFQKSSFPVLKHLPEKYIVLLPSTGNNNALWKTWPMRYWKEFMEHLPGVFPENSFIIGGDANEVSWGEIVPANTLFQNRIGKTSLTELAQLIAHASLFIGGDGGGMHLAAAFNTPTFTIWGGSNPERYGYEQSNPNLHQIILNKTNCQPCNDWIQPNLSKAKKPHFCPDFSCLRDLTPETVLKALRLYKENLSSSI